MKTRILMIAWMACMSQFCFSQDIITYRNGIEALGKVTEITETEIYYKKADNPDGPVYEVSKAEIFMIQYANGSKEIFGDDAESKKKENENKKEQSDFNQRMKYSGPRIGFTYIGQGTSRDNIAEYFGGTPFITQFGWQLETRVFTLENGTSGLFEWVGLVGGIEQGMFLPSISGLFGIRSKNGLEFGFGPNLSVSGFAMAFAVGTSFKSQNVYFPVNLGLVTSVPRKGYYYDENGNYIEITEHTGVRVGLTVGFNTRKK